MNGIQDTATPVQTLVLIEAALRLAVRYPVFPCRADKSPACAGGFKAATRDPDTIHRLFSAPGAELIGVPTGEASGIDVLDLDPRHGSDDWWNAEQSRIPYTLIHSTRSGGKHLLFQHQPGLRCSVGAVAPGCDVRADGGYIVWWPAAGCEVWLQAEPEPWPAWIILADLSAPRVAVARDLSAIAPPSAAAVIELLNRLPNPVHVDRTDYQRVMLAAAGCALAIGDDGEIGDAAVDWAERWEGGAQYDEQAKWDSDWSRRDKPLAGWQTLQSIAATLIPGYQHEQAEVDFAAIPDRVAPVAPAGFWRPFELRDASSIEPRDWVYGSHYIRKFVSVTVAPGAAGKSSNALVEALDMATGRGLLTGKPTSKRFRVLYWNGEDPLAETERRVVAACKLYGITAADLGDRFAICSGRDKAIRMAAEDRDGVAIARPLADELTAELLERRIDVMILDPFVRTHSVSENDNGAIDAVASEFARIADVANASIELVHHLRKASGMGQDRTAEDARGGVALIAAARSVRVLNVMQPAEAGALGISEETRRRCFRLDDGKTNMAPPAERAVWRFIESVDLGNSRPGLAADNVGVVKSWIKPAIGDVVTPEHVAEITRRLTAGEPNRRDPRSPSWAGQWIAAVLGIDMDKGGERKRVGKIIDAMIAESVLAIDTELDDRRRSRSILAPVAPVVFGADRSRLEQSTPHPCSAPVSRGCGGVEHAVGMAAPVVEPG